MRLRCYQITVRWLMFVVVIIGMTLGYTERWLRYRRLADHFLALSHQLATLREIRPNGDRVYDSSNNSWNHLQKAEEFEFAKWLPWISVAPDVKPEFEN